MKDANKSNAEMYGKHLEQYYCDEIESFANQMLQADYKEADSVEVAKEQTHLTKGQQQDLAELLR